MSNRVTTNIKQSNNPEDRWDANEVNLDLTRLDTSINNLSSDLVTTNTSQTINGQKTFFTLFLDPSSGFYTYNSIMDKYPFDISPMFGPSTYGLSSKGTYEEGRYDKKNASGTQMDLAGLNPVFMPSIIEIEVTGTDTVRVKALNVPLPVTTLGGSYSETNSDMTAYIWKTSAGTETTLTVTGLGTSSPVWHNIYINYNPETDSTSIDLTERSDLSTKVLTRCIGAVVSNSSALIKTYQHRGIIHFNESFTMGNLKSCTGILSNRNGSDKILSTSILKLRKDYTVIRNDIVYTNGISTFNDNNILNTIQNRPKDITLYVPIHKDGLYPSNYADGWIIEEINFGDLAI